MRFYNQPHQYYCGGDLHARTLYLHVLDAQGATRFEKNLPANPSAFLDAVQPFRDGLEWPDRRNGEVSGKSPPRGHLRLREESWVPIPEKCLAPPRPARAS
jgi:hypothetical protein